MTKTQPTADPTVQLVRPPQPPAPQPYVQIKHQTAEVIARQTGPKRFDLCLYNRDAFGGNGGQINVSLEELRDLLAGCEVLAHEAQEAA